ncbi:MAG: hypothetical protein IK021_01780 [Methanobrevibacter sp.]|nr:hypothetical protein [Methanobrevibacter sp.]
MVVYRTENVPAKIIDIQKSENIRTGKYGGRRKNGISIYTVQYEDGRKAEFYHWELNKTWFKYIK